MYYHSQQRESLLQWAFDQGGIGPVAKLVLLLMAHECKSPVLQIDFNNGQAARVLSVTVGTVRRAIAELERLELISYRGTKPLDAHRYLKIWKLEFDAE